MPEWLADALLLDAPAPAELVTRFQQTTPPVTAKGVEDTAFYRYNRLLALNEVGGDPGRFGLAVDAFHAGNQERLRAVPDVHARRHHPRHEALARHPVAPGGAGLDGRVGHGRRTHAARRARPPGPGLVRGHRAARRRRRARAERAVVPLPDPDRRVADRPRPTAHPPGEGLPGGEGPHVVDRAEHGLGGARPRLRPRGRRPAPVRRRPRRLPRAGPARGRAGIARPDAAAHHRPRHPRHLPGRRRVVPRARRPRQPPTDRLGAAPRVRSAGCATATRRRPTPSSSTSCTRRSSCAGAGRRRSPGPTVPSTPARTRWRSPEATTRSRSWWPSVPIPMPGSPCRRAPGTRSCATGRSRPTTRPSRSPISPDRGVSHSSNGVDRPTLRASP